MIENSENQTPPGRALAGLGGLGVSSGATTPETPNQIELAECIRAVEKWLGRYISFLKKSDALLCALWVIHTHLIDEFYSSPRLLISSPTFGSGKTTLLEHLFHLCREKPAHMANISSTAILARIHQPQIRTLLIDEADRTLSPKNPLHTEVISILNQGYKRGGSRSVQVPVKGGGWDVLDMELFAPVAIAGNAPNLPEDTRSRCITIRLMPSKPGEVQRTLWEDIEPNAYDLRTRIVSATNDIRDLLKRAQTPQFPEDIPPRLEEIWRPLMKIAVIAGKEIETATRELLDQDMETYIQDSENREVSEAPQMKMIRDLYEIYVSNEFEFSTTLNLIDHLVRRDSYWGAESSPLGKRLTARRMGLLLSNGFGINRQKQPGGNGYHRNQFQGTWEKLGISVKESPKPPETPQPPTDGSSEVF
jgi:hypothetical protein